MSGDVLGKPVPSIACVFRSVSQTGIDSHYPSVPSVILLLPVPVYTYTSHEGPVRRSRTSDSPTSPILYRQRLREGAPSLSEERKSRPWSENGFFPTHLLTSLPLTFVIDVDPPPPTGPLPDPRSYPSPPFPESSVLSPRWMSMTTDSGSW